MAFNRKPAATESESWRATAFLNISFEAEDGKRRKLGAIKLHDSKAFERAVIERLQQEGAVEALQGKIIIDFQMANKEVSADAVGF